jgi:GT2 family glycosyltransferase
LNGYYIGGADLSTIHEVDSVVGAFMFVRRDVGEQIGWWDEDYFLNGEDIDFCYRVKERGYRVVYNPESMIIHHRGASKGTRKESAQVTTASRNSKLLTTKASVDAMQIFYDKHYRKKYPRIINAIIDLGIIGVRIKRRLAVK